jgi:hypothetical protein
MKLFFLFLLAETIVYYAIMRIKLYFDVVYRRDDSNDELIIKIRIFKSLELYTMYIPAIKFDPRKYSLLPWLETQITADNHQAKIDTHSNKEQRFIKNSARLYALHPLRLRRAINMFFNWFGRYGAFMRKTIRSLHCEYFSWHTKCGTGDAATTALLTGCLWSLKGTVLKRIKQHAELCVKPNIGINPAWGNEYFVTAFQCIFTIRIGHVITAALKALFIRKKGVLENG